VLRKKAAQKNRGRLGFTLAAPGSIDPSSILSFSAQSGSILSARPGRRKHYFSINLWKLVDAAQISCPSSRRACAQSFLSLSYNSRCFHSAELGWRSL